jgi:hypothetical protein
MKSKIIPPTFASFSKENYDSYNDHFKDLDYFCHNKKVLFENAEELRMRS